MNCASLKAAAKVSKVLNYASIYIKINAIIFGVKTQVTDNLSDLI